MFVRPARWQWWLQLSMLSSHFVDELQPTLGGQHIAILATHWKRSNPQLTSPCPPDHVVPEKQLLRVPSSTTSSLLPPWWMAPHTVTDGPWLASVSHMRAFISVSPLACGAHKHGHHYETVWRETHHWRHSASNGRGPTFYVLQTTQA